MEDAWQMVELICTVCFYKQMLIFTIVTPWPLVQWSYSLATSFWSSVFLLQKKYIMEKWDWYQKLAWLSNALTEMQYYIYYDVSKTQYYSKICLWTVSIYIYTSLTSACQSLPYRCIICYLWNVNYMFL